ncbi:hypothetical protein JCGZ_25002 [Jatropha curcas]|uniref:DUF3741 domain-containing protein n=1 Tax=Jatropha curcas TaxID=180498 RepID=A0A067JNP9_JATCU|nr:uncharacterized protein LOC105646581 [Jatropha curcas]KDP24438.1 hypothetical protein JCGZ_25002 [Jatropha curcas]
MPSSNSRTATPSGCFSSIARLLLCKGSLQTHPSDQITDHVHNTATEFKNLNEASKHDQVNFKVKVEASAAAATPGPGVVARLMGLDSLPDTNRIPTNGNTVTRSRSVNFMDYLFEFDLSQAHHRRVKTSLSFRDVPTLQNQKNNDFFLLYLDNIEKTKKTRPNKFRKAEVGLEESNKKEEKGAVDVRKEKKNQRNNNLKISKLKDEPRKQVMHDNKQFSRPGSCKGGQVSSGFVSPKKVKDRRVPKGKSKCAVKPINQKEVLVESKLMKKIKKQRAMKDLQCYSECSSDDSSPVSVLDLDEFPIYDDQTSLSPDCTIGHQNSNPEKKFPPKATDFEYCFSHPARLLNTCDNATKYYTEVVRELCKLTEEDMKESKWVSENVLQLESFEEMCLDFGQQILDVLVKQLVEELVGFHN